MPLITVNPDECTRDGMCVDECPLRLLTLGDGGVPREIPMAAELCIRCGHCVSVCPRGALQLGDISPDDLTAASALPRVSAKAAVHFLKTRRSIRSYTEDPVPRDVLLQVLDAARWAPTASNRQPVKWIVVEDRSRVLELAKLVAEGLRPIPYFARLTSDWDEGKDRVFRGAPHVLIAYGPTDWFDPQVDCTITLAYLDLAAHGFGLGTCWAGVVMAAIPNNRAILPFLDIPEGHRVCGAMMIGYPKYAYKRIPPRNPLDVTWK